MKLEDNIRILNEKIYGGLATVYHGSYSNPDLFYKERFQPGNGAGSMYGDGIYSVYDLLSGTNTEKGSYGPYIIKMVASTYRVVNFNTLYKIYEAKLLENEKKLFNALEYALTSSTYNHIYKKMLSEPTEYYDIKQNLESPELKNPIFDLYTGLETMFFEPLIKMGFDRKFYNEFVNWLQKIGWFWFSKTFYYDHLHAGALHTSRIAKPFSDDFYDYLCGNGTKELVNGIIFVGANDGPVMVIYNLNNYIPIAHYEREHGDTSVEDIKWQYLSKQKQTEFLKKQKEYFSKHRFGKSKNITDSSQTEEEKILAYAFDMFVNIKNKKFNAPVADTLKLSFIPFLVFLKKSGKDMYDMRNFIDKVYTTDMGDENNLYKGIQDIDLQIIDDFLHHLDSKAIDYYFNNFDSAIKFTSEYLTKIVQWNFDYFYKSIIEYNILEPYINILKSASIHPMLNLFEIMLSSNTYYRQKIVDEKNKIEDILMIMINNTPKEYYSHLHSMAMAHKQSFYSKHFLTMIKEKNIQFPLNFIYISELLASTGSMTELIDLIYYGSINLEKTLFENKYNSEEINRINVIANYLVKTSLRLLEMDSSYMTHEENALYVLTKKILLPCIEFLLLHDPKFKEENTSDKKNVVDLYLSNIQIVLRQNRGNYDFSEERKFTVDSFIHIMNRNNIFVSSLTLISILEDIFVNLYSLSKAKAVSPLISTVANQLSNYPEKYEEFIEYILVTELEMMGDRGKNYALLIKKVLYPDETFGYGKETAMIQNFIWNLLNNNKYKYERIFKELEEYSGHNITYTNDDLKENNNYYYL